MTIRKAFLLAGLFALCVFAVRTWRDVAPVAGSLRSVISDAAFADVTDRGGVPLGVSYQNRWNTFNYVPLHDIPEFLQRAFVISEDKRFFEHNGIDTRALASAAWTNARSFSRVRGASTITQQAVRIVHDRPRTYWSKWIESWEAVLLEAHVDKSDILEFYCNEVPYASNRRGVVQAASHYFDRDLSTLNKQEMLALVVLARAPTAYDLYRNPNLIQGGIRRLALRMEADGVMTKAEVAALDQQSLRLASPQLPVEAGHFVRYVRTHAEGRGPHEVMKTTLDASLQRQVTDILRQRLVGLSSKAVGNAAAMVVDHRTAEVLAWVVVGGAGAAGRGATHQIDAVTVARQPGSALKPFLYALALEKGWTPATIIDDAPMAEAIGSGLHAFNNYSHSFYGKVTLREALGNSLNIPALRTIGFVGVKPYLDRLHVLGFQSLDRDAEIYRDGLALGNGEVSLFEMVQAYTALANRGLFRPLRTIMDEDAGETALQAFTPEVASLIGNVLSDPWARRMEFGYGSVLNLPVQTAVKTGTSTDYHDAWTLGFDSRYVVGIWMGNLDRAATDGVTGSLGPAMALRSIFAHLRQDDVTDALYLSPSLVPQDVCLVTGNDHGPCRPRTEYFLSGTVGVIGEPTPDAAIKLARPTQGLQMAYDPRIPAANQVFSFQIEGLDARCGRSCAVTWSLNGSPIATTDAGTYRWAVRRGTYDLVAEVQRDGQFLFKSGVIHFTVK